MPGDLPEPLKVEEASGAGYAQELHPVSLSHSAQVTEVRQRGGGLGHGSPGSPS